MKAFSRQRLKQRAFQMTPSGSYLGSVALLHGRRYNEGKRGRVGIVGRQEMLLAGRAKLVVRDGSSGPVTAGHRLLQISFSIPG